jgi:hypothetical protein
MVEGRDEEDEKTEDKKKFTTGEHSWKGGRKTKEGDLIIDQK